MLAITDIIRIFVVLKQSRIFVSLSAVNAHDI
nr:MAG TPA: hypothetical protein [Caudoviricetes sp.]